MLRWLNTLYFATNFGCKSSVQRQEKVGSGHLAEVAAGILENLRGAAKEDLNFSIFAGMLSPGSRHSILSFPPEFLPRVEDDSAI